MNQLKQKKKVSVTRKGVDTKERDGPDRRSEWQKRGLVKVKVTGRKDENETKKVEEKGQ